MGEWVGISVRTLTAVGVLLAAVVGPAADREMTAQAAPASGRRTTDVQPRSGTATYYESDGGGGNCSFVGGPADDLHVALSNTEYGTADVCGGYLDVVGPRGSVRVKVTNRCPECPVGHIDLSRTAFGRIADTAAGQVPVSYQLVPNPPIGAPISMRVKEGSSQWWLQIQPLDTGNPVASLEVQTGDSWRSLVHTQDNFWMAEDPGAGPGPFTVRITDIYGQSVTVDGITLSPNQLQTTGARLYGGGPPPPPTTAPVDTATTSPTPTRPAPTTTVTSHPTTTTDRLAAQATPSETAKVRGADGPDAYFWLVACLVVVGVVLAGLTLLRSVSGP